MTDTHHDPQHRITEDLERFVTGVKDSMTIQRVFGEPIDRNGVTVIPVAAVRGGAGGGGGEGGPVEAEGAGSGVGFGVSARPVGTYVIKDDDVRWLPAVDPAKVAMVIIAVSAFVWRIAVAIAGRQSSDGTA